MINESISLVESSLAEMLNDCSIDGIISIDNDWNVTAWNKTAEMITGKARQRLSGKPLLEILPAIKEDNETMHAIAGAFNGFKAFVPASDLFSHRRQLENYYIPLKNNQAEIVGVMNIMHDVAHRIKAEMQLQALHAELQERYRQLQLTSSELASFTHLTSNNIKTPIRTLYTTIEQLVQTESQQLSNNGKAAFRRMQSSLNKMNLLLDDMLGLARISMPETPGTIINLEPVLHEVIDALKNTIKEKNVQFVIRGLCSVTGHHEQLRLLFLHLISNAIKFNESILPCVTLDSKKITLQQRVENFIVEKEYYRVTITDNGIGIEPADTEKIFNMFEKLHPEQRYKGSGMGLAIARKIMYAHKGYIEVESVAGQGSSFHCFFPVM